MTASFLAVLNFEDKQARMSDYPNVTVMEETVSRGDRLSCCSGYSPTVKIAGLWKRSQGLRRFTKPNYRHRVFILTDQALSYYAGTLDVSLYSHLAK